MPSAHQVRNKTRAAVRRREERIEEEELESGEINLIPYLDIVTNLMLFLLASITANILFGQINTQLPDPGAPQPTTAANPNPTPDEKPLGLAIAVKPDELILFSFSGLEGTLQQPKLRLPRVGKVGDTCDTNAMCETNACSADRRCEDRGQPITPVFDYRQLNEALVTIATTHFVGTNPPNPRPRKAESYQAVLMADASIPYGTLVAVIGSMRCKMPAFGTPSTGCFLPTADETLKAAANPVDDKARLYDTARTNYDPNLMALFPDVVFSGGFR